MRAMKSGRFMTVGQHGVHLEEFLKVREAMAAMDGPRARSLPGVRLTVTLNGRASILRIVKRSTVLPNCCA